MADDAVTKALFPPRMIEDLRKSGLTPADVRAKPLSPAEKAATGSPMAADGYVLPYFNMVGEPIQFYRVKLFDGEPKYRQIADTANHVYFPPRLNDLLPTAKYLILTEGEKKAACAVAHGYPCVAIGGVDSWRNRTILLPKDTAIAQKSNGAVSAKLQPGMGITEAPDTMATGLDELIRFVIRKNIPLIICFDSDRDYGLKFEVARACATLGYELRFRGIPVRHIRHLVLDTRGEGKMGLDDYLEHPDFGPEAFEKALLANLAQRSAFPRHPNPREYVNRRLQRSRITRQDLMGLAMAVLSDLDAKGQRLRSPDEDELYYFSHQDKSLSRVSFAGEDEFPKSPFGVRLYKDYMLGFNDQKVLGWLSSMFAGEDPIQNVRPEKVLVWKGDTLYYHLNSGRVVKVNKDAITIQDNGDDGVLFLEGLSQDIEENEFKTALFISQENTLKNHWMEVLKDARIKEDQGDIHRQLLSLLYYISPWFYRWRGTELPVEITTGEAGSGKSTLYKLRLDILTGLPKLRNSPSDLRDWTASLANSGGLHVTDNVQMTDANLRQKLSDEICRLVTESNPTVEQRKLYSNSEIVQIPVSAVFAITAIKQPFTAVDIIQRSIITELDKGTSDELTYDADWESHQLSRFGGRARWVAHHLVVVQKILQLVHSSWTSRYKAKYRLINVEQLLVLTAKVVGIDPTWIPDYLEGVRDKRAQEADWTLEGLVAYRDWCQHMYKDLWHKQTFTAQDIAEWSESQDLFKGCALLANGRTLGRYMASNKHTVATIANIIPLNAHGGVTTFRFRRDGEHGEVEGTPKV